MAAQSTAVVLQRVLAFAALALLLSASSIEAKRYGRKGRKPMKATHCLATFGDSLTDTGNFFRASGNRFPLPSIYFQGRFTNSPGVWVDELKNMYPNLNIYNFAVAGASACPYSEAILTALPALRAVPDVGRQVGMYLNRLSNNTYKPGDHIPVIWAGNNDFLVANLIPPAEVAALPARIAGCLSQYVSTILSHPQPPKSVIVANIPPLENLPQAILTNLASVLGPLAVGTNLAISQALDALRLQYPNNNIILWDIAQPLNELDVNFMQQGFTSNSSCLTVTAEYRVLNGDQPQAVCNNPNDFVFYDNIHPTTRVHQIFARSFVATLRQSKVIF